MQALLIVGSGLAVVCIGVASVHVLAALTDSYEVKHTAKAQARLRAGAPRLVPAPGRQPGSLNGVPNRVGADEGFDLGRWSA